MDKYKRILLKYNYLLKLYKTNKIASVKMSRKYLNLKKRYVFLRRYSNKKVMNLIEKIVGETYQVIFDSNRNLIKISDNFLKEIDMTKSEFADSFTIDILFDKYLPPVNPAKSELSIEEFHFPILIKNYENDELKIHPYQHFQFSGKIKYVKNKKKFFYFLNITNISSDVELNYIQNTDTVIKSLSVANINLMQAKRTIEVHKIMLIFLTCSLIEEYNMETSHHLQRIKAITEHLTRECKIMGLIKVNDYDLEEYIKDINYTSVLHDIGKMGVPREILEKEMSLTDEEAVIMKKHTQIGAGYIKNIIDFIENDNRYSKYKNFLHIPYEICLHHHERWDGKGYPNGLKGDEIPISARIVSIADTYDAIRGARVYDKARDHDEAVNIILKESGKQFDSRLVEAFLKIEKKLKSLPYTDNSG